MKGKDEDVPSTSLDDETFEDDPDSASASNFTEFSHLEGDDSEEKVETKSQDEQKTTINHRQLANHAIGGHQNRATVAQEARRFHATQERNKVHVKSLEDEIAGLKAKLEAKDEYVEKVKLEKEEMGKVMELQNAHVLELQNALKRRKETIDELGNQLKQSEDEFEMLGEAMEERETLIKTKNSTIVDLKDKNEKLNDEIDRMKVMLRKATGPPPAGKEDVCLSARSFTENDLITLRDEAIATKEKQIELINANNNSLRQSIDHLEAEITRMQFDLANKDKQIYKLQDEKADALERVEKLEVQVQEKEGRDGAMEVATKQNSQLLQLLQQQETLSHELEEKNSALEDRIQELETKHRLAVKARVEFEVQSTAEAHQVSRLKKELASLKTTAQAEEKLLRSRLERLEKESTATIEKQREELRMRREKHYEMLERVQTSEDKVRAADERVTEVREEMEQLKNENREIDARLIENKRWAQVQEVNHRKTVAKLSNEIVQLKNQLKDMENQRNALSVQLYEMSETVIKAVEKQQGAMDEAVEMQVEVDRRENDLCDMKKHMVNEATLQGKHRMKAELERKTLLDQMKQLRKENSVLAQATNANFEQQSNQVDSLEKRCKTLEVQLEQAIEAQRNRFDRILRFMNGASCLVEENNAEVLNLDDCHLGHVTFQSEQVTNENLTRLAKQVLGILESPDNPTLPLVINLAHNYLNDRHIPICLAKIAQASFQSPCVTLDLTGNHISSDGIRRLVLALGKNPRIQHVYIARDGTIQGLRGSNIIYIVDMKQNKPVSDSKPSNGLLPQI